MRVGTVAESGTRVAVVGDERGRVYRATDLSPELPPHTLELIAQTTATELHALTAETSARPLNADSMQFVAPYLRPRKIWGIGLNYREHAGDLDAVAPTTTPASFMKGDHTIIGPGEPVPLPALSQEVTAEAELGLIIGRECRHVSTEDALDVVWGVCPILDQTAEDLLRQNPRYLTIAKNFEGFFSFGPWIISLDEALHGRANLDELEVETVLNGEVRRRNVVGAMTFSPERLISLHSEVMPLFAGDIISTGTPGAVRIQIGDVAACRITGVGTLTNPVIGS